MNDSHILAHRICDAYAVSRIPETRKLQSISEESLDDVSRYVIPDDLLFEKSTIFPTFFFNFQQYHEMHSDFRKPYWILTIYWLIHRNFLIVVRDPSVQMLRIVQKIVRTFSSFIKQFRN